MKVISPLEDYFRQLFPFQFNGKLDFLLCRYSPEVIATEISCWMELADQDLSQILRFAKEFYCKSNLQDSERDAFLKALERSGFFIKISQLLCTSDYTTCISIFHFLSNFPTRLVKDLLEKQYLERYYPDRPLLAACCLDTFSCIAPRLRQSLMGNLYQMDTLEARMILLFCLMGGLRSGSRFDEVIGNPQVASLIFPLKWREMRYEDFYLRLKGFKTDVLNHTGFYRDFPETSTPDKIENMRKYFMFLEAE